LEGLAELFFAVHKRYHFEAVVMKVLFCCTQCCKGAAISFLLKPMWSWLFETRALLSSNVSYDGRPDDPFKCPPRDDGIRRAKKLLYVEHLTTRAPAATDNQ
jgi:hypothetical protein